MSQPVPRFRAKAILGTCGKLAFGVAVFATTVSAYTYISDAARMHSALPDDRESDGRCILWLVGSSSVHRWKSAGDDLPGWQVHNRGIEAARLPELQARLALTKSGGRPAAIVLYAGENDLADGAEAMQVASGLVRLTRTLAQHAPGTKLFLVSMKPSPTRWANREAQLAVNAGLRRFAGAHPTVDYIAAGETLLVDGKPGAFYEDDGIHLSKQGYARWGEEIEQHLDRRYAGLATRCGINVEPQT